MRKSYYLQHFSCPPPCPPTVRQVPPMHSAWEVSQFCCPPPVRLFQESYYLHYFSCPPPCPPSSAYAFRLGGIAILLSASPRNRTIYNTLAVRPPVRQVPPMHSAWEVLQFCCPPPVRLFQESYSLQYFSYPPPCPPGSAYAFRSGGVEILLSASCPLLPGIILVTILSYSHR